MTCFYYVKLFVCVVHECRHPQSPEMTDMLELQMVVGGAMWVLRTKLRAYARAVWLLTTELSISPAPHPIFSQSMLIGEVTHQARSGEVLGSRLQCNHSIQHKLAFSESMTSLFLLLHCVLHRTNIAHKILNFQF